MMSDKSVVSKEKHPGGTAKVPFIVRFPAFCQKPASYGCHRETVVTQYLDGPDDKLGGALRVFKCASRRSLTLVDSE